MTAEETKITRDNDNPVSRLEVSLNAIATNTAAMRRAYDAIFDLEQLLDEAVRRQETILRALDRFDDKYVATLKASPRHAAFMRKIREVKAVLGHGLAHKITGDPGDDSSRSLEGLLAKVDAVRKEIAKTPLMTSGQAFIEPVTAELEGIRPLYQELHRLLVTPLPKAAEPLAVGSLADNDGWVSLLLKIKEAPESEKTRLVAAGLRTAAEDMGRIARQAAKLEARATGKGSTEAEKEAARRRSYALHRSIDALRKRMVTLAASFYSKRQRTLAGLVEATKEATSALRAPGVTIETLRDVKTFRNRHGIQRLADDLLGLDAALDRGKGMNPTLGNLMKYFHDNAQRRITNG